MKEYRATNYNLPFLGKPLVDDFRFTCDTRQTVFQSTVAMREALVIEAKHCQQSCVEIVNVDRINSRIPTNFISFAIGKPSFDATSRHKHCEGIRMMIASGVSFSTRAIFAQWRAAKFGASNDQSFIE